MPELLDPRVAQANASSADSGQNGARTAPGGPGASAVPAAASPPRPRDRSIMDVWSRTDAQHRPRAAALLLLNLFLFCCLCVFTHWLHFATPFDFAIESYLAPMRFWGPQTQSLNDFILFPISVEQTPFHGVVLGLLVAAIVSIPISVALLYRFVFSLPFVAAVLVFAHLPWMALTLTASCVLASVRPFKLPWKFASALVGLIPVLAYLYLATRGSAEQVGASAAPDQKALIGGTWVLAILGACLMTGLILLIARIVNYRPGFVAPVIAVMFATPAVLFYTRVGADELIYRILEAEYGPRSSRFMPVQDATDRIRQLVHHWTEPGVGEERRLLALSAIWSDDRTEQQALKQRVCQKFAGELLSSRYVAVQVCQQFIADYPRSRYVPNVLFIQARILDTRLDERKLASAEPVRELYADFPHVQSESVWTALLKSYPDSPLSIAARVRVAQLRLRRGEVDGALELLTAAAATPTARPATQPDPRGLLASPPPETSLRFAPGPYQFDARRWCELIRANRDDPKYGNEPLAALAALDAHRAGYLAQLGALAARYPDARAYDNLLVWWAKELPQRAAQVEALRRCIRIAPAGDAYPEALYRLAELELQTGDAATAEAGRAAAIVRLKEIAERFAATCWGQLATERLRILAPAAATTG